MPGTWGMDVNSLLPTFNSITPTSATAVELLYQLSVRILLLGFIRCDHWGTPATSVVWVDAIHITAVSPGLKNQNIVIINNDGQTVTGTGAFHMQPPSSRVFRYADIWSQTI